MTQLTLEQVSKVTTQGEQLFIVIQKKHHPKLAEKKLLGKDLNVTIVLKSDD